MSLYALAADLLLLGHFLLALFVVLGLVLVFVGKFRSWAWVRNPWIRTAHLLAVTVVVAQSWLGVVCPLTRWEMALRVKAGEAAYQGAFMAHWLHLILYYQAPSWVFVVAYTAFGALVLYSWLFVRPRGFKG